MKLLFFGLLKNRIQVLRQLFRFDPAHGFLFIDQPFFDHIHGNPNRGNPRSLAGPRLQHIERTFLNRKLHVLHVTIMFLQNLLGGHERLIGNGQRVLQGGHGKGRTKTRHHVFTLGIQETFPENRSLARGRVSRKHDAGAAGLAHVAEHHGHDVDRGTPRVRDAVNLSIGHRPVTEPGCKHRPDRHVELLERILGKRPAGFLLDDALIRGDQLAESFRGQVGIGRGSNLLLFAFQDLVKLFTRHVHHHGAEHRDEPAIRIQGKACIVGLVGQPLDGLRVQAEVQHRIHHPGHGRASPGPHGHQQRVSRVPEPRLHQPLHPLQPFQGLIPHAGRVPFSVAEIFEAGVGRDGESRRDANLQIGHFREAGTLPPEQRLHGTGAFGFAVPKRIDVLLVTHA